MQEAGVGAAVGDVLVSRITVVKVGCFVGDGVATDGDAVDTIGGGGDSVGNSVGAAVGEAAGEDVMGVAAVGDTLGAAVGGTVMGVAAVGNALGAAVGEAVGDAVGEAVGSNVTHLFDSQRPPRQSSFSTHVPPITHPWHNVPPQSKSVSSPFRMPSRHSPTARDSVGDAVGETVGDAVGETVGDAVGESIGDAVGDSVGALVGEFVGDVVGDSVGALVGDSVGDAVGDFVGTRRSPATLALSGVLLGANTARFPTAATPPHL